MASFAAHAASHAAHSSSESGFSSSAAADEVGLSSAGSSTKRQQVFANYDSAFMLRELYLTSFRMQGCPADMEQLSIVWHDIQQLVAGSEGSLAGASLGGLSALLMSSALNRSVDLL